MKDNREGGNFFDLIEEKLEKWGMPGGEAVRTSSHKPTKFKTPTNEHFEHCMIEILLKKCFLEDRACAEDDSPSKKKARIEGYRSKKIIV
ncbi:hypothetical protein RIR_jg41968.t1 [Rhizophagus irregularis DAOM 181602=DAOM 197198]|nr:hypothetical protein RIR_jg41968.t1 [Rhizophagus irregularis DAOM 181602=DAOM 197198]